MEEQEAGVYDFGLQTSVRPLICLRLEGVTGIKDQGK